MIRKPLILGAATLLALTLVAVGSNSNVNATHIVGGAASMAVDADPTGNTATVLGNREACIQTTAGSDVVVDVTLSNLPAANPMISFSFTMMYDQTMLSVSAVDTSNKLLSTGATSAATYLGDESTAPTTVTPGIFAGVGLDTSANTSSQESGSGVLERLTISVDPGAADGGYPLHLIEAVTINGQGAGFDAGLHASAQIAVGVSCGTLSAVEPPPSINGDVDCSNTVNAVDALKVLRNNSSLTVAQTEPCVDVAANIPHVGDVDCSGAPNAVDALKILRKNASLSVTYTEPCDDIGT